ncbi:midasin-like [Schistocerca americana]|uniref:midasin-like n=1 Tax=Schistocerca americana TaxID=7009 RepID=UPI001F4F1891|nr:midasin-like [Schistocerca americana]
MLGVSDKTLNLSRLEQTASLLWHQLARGHKALTSLPAACYDVYTRAVGSSQSLRASIQQVLVEKLSRYRSFLKHSTREDTFLPLSVLACPAPLLTTNSVFTGLKGSAAALLTVAANVELSSETISMVTGVDVAQNSTSLLEDLAFALFSMMSHRGMQLADNWLLSKVQPSGNGILQPAFQMYHKLSIKWRRLICTGVVPRRLGVGLQEVDICDWKELPWDVRWLPFAQQQCSNINLNWHAYCATVNSIHVLNYFTFISHQMEKRKVKPSSLTLLDLSQKFTKGEVDSVHCQQLLLQKLYTLVTAVNICIEQLAVMCPEMFSDDNSLAEIMNSVMWVERFTQQGYHPVPKGGVRPSSLEMLTLHFCWLRKHVIPLITNDRLCRIVPRAREVLQIARSLNEVFLQGTSAVITISRRLRDIIGYVLHMDCDLRVKLNRTCAILSCWQEHEREAQKQFGAEWIKAFLTKPSGVKTRENLIEAYRMLWSDCSSAEVTRLSDDAISSFSAEDEDEDDHRTSDAAFEATTVPSELWPVMEVLSLRLGMAALAVLLQNPDKKSEEDSKVVDEAAKFFSRLPSTPLKLAAIYLTAKHTKLQDGTVPEMIRWQLAHLVKSLACNNTTVKSAESLVEVVDLEADTSKITSCLPHYSLLALHSWRLVEKAFGIGANGDMLQNVSLSDYKEHCIRLEMLRAFLWKNAIALDSSYLDIVYYDALACKGTFSWFLDALIHSVPSSNSLLTSSLSISEKIDTARKFLRIAEPHRNYTNNLNGCLSLCESFEDIVQFHEQLQQELSRGKSTVQIRITAMASQLWFAMGQFQMSIFTHLGLVDPVRKRTMKLSYAKEELEFVERLLKAFEVTARLQSRNWEVIPDAEVPPFIRTLRLLKAMLNEKCTKLEQQISTRPQNAKPFTLLRKEIENYKLNLHGKMGELSKQLSAVTHKLLQKEAQNGMTQGIPENRMYDILSIRREAVDVIDTAFGMRESQQAFTARLQNMYGDHYPDLVTPILFALTQVSYAIEVQCSVIHKLIEPNDDTWKLLCYPSIGTVYQTVNEILLKSSSGSDWSFQQCMASLHDLGCLMSVMGNYNDNSRKVWAHLHNHLKYVVSIWKKQDDEKRLREKEKEALYVHKSTVSEEQQNEEELNKLFPVWSTQDFSEFQPQSLEQSRPVSDSVASKDSQQTNPLLTEDDFYSVVKLHGSLVRAFSHSLWLQGSAKQYTPDFSKALLLRYEHMHEDIPNILQSQNSFVDSKLIASLLVLATTESHRKRVEKSDFYQTGQIEETARCLPVLRRIRSDICKLLEQFPNFPTLSQMLIVVDRILGFPVSSPLPRFLTGLELLLSKFEEWEQNAHQGVSLLEHRAALTQLIFDWRRKELDCWKSAFDAALTRAETKATKWWFYLFSVIESFVSDEGEKTSIAELEGTLKAFIENGTLGDFETRLEMLFNFHCHVLHMETSERQEVMLCLLWNLYKRFSQLKVPIAERLARLRNPIERELRDFVKISHWKDTSYWAVREAVAKSHRTVHKRIREFEKVLAEPALVPGVGVKTGGTIFVRFPTVNAAAFIMPLAWRNLFTMGDVLPHLESLFMKCRRRSRQLAERSEYGMLLGTLASVMNELFERADEDNKTEVNRSLPKEKQKSEAKHLLHRRRKTLTDIFHSLQLMGLSYRTGRRLCEDQTMSCFVLLPVDPVIAVTSPDAELLSAHAADSLIKQSWLGCENLSCCAEIHYEQLVGFLKSPAQDLGPANIERLQGFAFHLLALAREQKSMISSSVKQLHGLRRIVMELSTHCQDTCDGAKPSEIVQAKSRVVDLLATVQMCMEQFRVALKSCPSTSSPQVPQVWLSTKNHMPALVSASYGDAEWRDSDALICDIVLTTGNLKASLDIPVIKLKSVVEAYSGLQTIMQKLKKLQLKFEEDDTNLSQNPLAECVRWLSTHVHQELESFHKSSLFATVNSPSYKSGSQVLGSESKTDDFMFDVLSQVPKVHLSPDLLRDPTFRPKMKETLVKIMLVVQKLYKRNDKISVGAGNDDVCNVMAGGTDMEETQGIDKENNMTKNAVNVISSTPSVDTFEHESHHELQKDHFKEKILGGLKTDISYLNLSAIFDTVSDIKNMLISVLEVGKETETSVYYKRLIQMLLPFLHQLALLAELTVFQQIQAFHVSCQLLNKLLPLFQHLAQKGFGIPPDLMPDDEGEDSGPAKGGMGLGDGEGETDVSERIESEDQLEDARPKGQEPETDDEKECKEESKGIETSEDFGGKAQDIDKSGDDENESEGNSEEDLDAEMDDTTGAEEKLDKQVWGSDSEDEKEEEMPEDDARGGEKDGEPELGAANGKRKRDEESDEEAGSGDEKRKQQRPEINEMDEPEPDDDQIDPYHGKQPPEPEPEAFDLPEDLQLDDGAGKDDAEANEENPFDIDEMKEQKEPEKENTDETSEGKEKNDDKTEEPESSSEDEMDNNEDPNGTTGLEQGASDKEEENAEITKGEKDGKEGENEDKGNDQEEASPSDDQPSHNAAEPAPEQAEAGSKDQVSSVPKEDEKDSKDGGDAGDPGEMEQSGVGGAQMKDDQTGHQGRPEGDSTPEARADQQGQRDVRKRDRPGQSDAQRSLGDVKEPTVKRLKTVDVTNKEQESKSEDETEEGADLGRSADLYQHIRDSKEAFDAHTIDAATEEQAEKQPVPNLEEEKGEELNDDDIEMIEDQPPANEKSPQQRIPAENVPGAKDKSDLAGENMDTGGDGETNVEVEGERVETVGVKRGAETTFNTTIKESESVPVSRQVVEEETQAIRLALEKQLGSWVQPPSDAEAERAWDSFSHTTQELARDLCEQLRLVLEPTQASRLRGDFRTGRRINMRKVIPYIASQFRKDKIWLRRTKPSKREYQIVLGIDDSSSMDYNQAKEMTFESVALVSQALTLLEVGELGVVSFGEDIHILHQLGQPFTHTSGATLLQHLRFDQRSTKVGSLVQFVTEMFENHGTRSSADRAQLLVILSDGRGVRSEGKLLVERAVGRARQERIFTVFIIIDNPKYETSILDVRNTDFTGGKVKFTSYMDDFPFPFYVVLRDVSALPAVLSDALRQWFELVATFDS